MVEPHPFLPMSVRASERWQLLTEDSRKNLLPKDVPHAKITVCKFGNDANLIGVVQTYMAKYGETIY